MTAPAPPSQTVPGHPDSGVEPVLSKPLARTRSPTPSADEPSRKRHRPDSPSLQYQSHSQGPDRTLLKTSAAEENCSPKPQLPDQLPDKTSKLGTSDDGDNGGDEGASAGTEEGEEQEEGELPPLPPGPPPEEAASDGWEAVWEPDVGQYYFYNHLTGETTWENPRVPHPDPAAAVGTTAADSGEAVKQYSGYVPAIHGDYDPTAAYAQQPERTPSPTVDLYAAHAAFNRFNGRFQNDSTAERPSEESRARRQMEIYFDVDAAANCHDGRSLKAERQAKKLTKKEVKAFREKTRLKKEEKKRAWLRD